MFSRKSIISLLYLNRNLYTSKMYFFFFFSFAKPFTVFDYRGTGTLPVSIS